MSVHTARPTPIWLPSWNPIASARKALLSPAGLDSTTAPERWMIAAARGPSVGSVCCRPTADQVPPNARHSSGGLPARARLRHRSPK